MKKILNILAKTINVLYKILPFFLGMNCYYPFFANQSPNPETGLKIHVYPFLDAVYASLKLYAGCTESGIVINMELQIARFLALAATLSILVYAFNKLTDLVNGVKLIGSGSVVVYGKSIYADQMFESLDPRIRIRGDEKFVGHASKYLLMFSSDKENLQFYNRNYKLLKDKNVYIMLESTARQNIENPLITVFSISENSARQYWKNYPVMKSEKIAIIGFDNVGKNILIYGLQMNLIDPEQHFEYHIFGDGSEFRIEHTELDKMLPDEIVFHDDGIYKYSKSSKFDRIIICGGENDNIPLVSKLIMSAPRHPDIYVYAPNGDIITNLFGNERVHCFGMAEESASTDIIFNEKLMEDARRQHEDYVNKYGGSPWEKLDSFKRYSNVSSSDYMYTIERLMEQDIPFDTIAELEHMRWCRYHYINNWKYGTERNDSERIHNSLVPFSELSDEEKQKDIDAVKSKLKK